jgi:allantoinase
MPWDLLIRNGQVVMRDGVHPLDLAIEDGKIVEIAAEIRGSAREEIDATGLHVFPGVIDPHVHFNEPGRTDWEGWATGSAALAAGGGTCCFEMPLNANPPTLDGPSFDLKRAAAEASSLADFGLWGGLTPDNLDTMDELADRGVIGFKAFMSGSGIAEFGRADDETLRRGMEIAARRGLIVAVHAESEEITSLLTKAIRSRGGKTWTDYLESRPVEAEIEAIRRVIRMAGETDCQLHIVHVSSAAGAWAAHSTYPVMNQSQITFETCPHYFMLTSDDLLGLGARAKCAPPLRTERDAENFRFMFTTGEISFVASDHSPAPASMKTGDDAFEIWGGISGVQSTLPAMLSIRPPLPAEAVGKYTATNIAKRFEVWTKGEIDVGFDADLALVDLEATYTLTRDMLLDRHKLSPYVGRQFRGLVKRTVRRGETIFRDGKIAGTSRGQLIKPATAERGNR